MWSKSGCLSQVQGSNGTKFQSITDNSVLLLQLLFQSYYPSSKKRCAVSLSAFLTHKRANSAIWSQLRATGFIPTSAETSPVSLHVPVGLCSCWRRCPTAVPCHTLESLCLVRKQWSWLCHMDAGVTLPDSVVLSPVSLGYKHGTGQRGVPQNKAQLHRRANSWLQPQKYCFLHPRKRCIYTSVSQSGSGTFSEVVVGSEWTVSVWSTKNGHMYLWKLSLLMFSSQGWWSLVMAAYKIWQNSSQKNIPCLSQPFILSSPLTLTHAWIPVRDEHLPFKLRGSITTCENCCLKDSSVCCW